MTAPGLAEKLHNEVLSLVTFLADNGKRKSTLDIRLIKKQCPLLLGCQREGVHAANHMVARRAITADMLLTARVVEESEKDAGEEAAGHARSAAPTCGPGAILRLPGFCGLSVRLFWGPRLWICAPKRSRWAHT